MNDEISKLKQDQENRYKEAIKETIKNNTNALVNDDIKMLLNKPPLDSMDVLKVKIIEQAKKNKIIVNNDSLVGVIEKYRKNVIKTCDEIIDLRITTLNRIVDQFKFHKKSDVIKINRKDFNDLNKKLKKLIKNNIISCYEKHIENKFSLFFDKNIDEKTYNSIKENFDKFFNKTYLKQLFESIDIKILVKDTTLINTTKEQAERYLFIINNSRLFNEDN